MMRARLRKWTILCRVGIETPVIGTLPRANIEQRFLDRSFEVKIRVYE